MTSVSEIIQSRNFDDYYEITNEYLGSGSYGKVNTAICKSTGQKYAVKVLEVKSKFSKMCAKREIEAFEKFSNEENIVKMKEFFKVDSRYYIVLEKFDGDVGHYCRKKRMSEIDAAKVVRNVALALRTLHSFGIAHRDIKLENILFSGQDFCSVKLSDFGTHSGFNRIPCCEYHDNTYFSSYYGTSLYMAPEVARLRLTNYGHYTKQCDMWSLGVSLYIMLSKRRPFFYKPNEHCQCTRKETCEDCDESLMNSILIGKYLIDKIPNSISEDAKDLIMKLMEVDEDDRYTPDQVLEHPWIKYWQDRNCLQDKNPV